MGSRANLHCLVPVRHAPVAWVHGATNAMSNAKLNLCPLVQHKPPTPRPGCHRTPTSRKPTCNNAKEGGLNVPTRDPGLGRPIKRLHHAGTAPVAGCYTLYGALHPIRTGAMPTDRVHRARRQERSRNLASHNTKETASTPHPTQNPGLDGPASARDAQAFENVTRCDMFDQSDARGVCW